jgi:hypothetical protein
MFVFHVHIAVHRNAISIVCMYVCMYVRMCVSMYDHVHTQTYTLYTNSANKII